MSFLHAFSMYSLKRCDHRIHCKTYYKSFTHTKRGCSHWATTITSTTTQQPTPHTTAMRSHAIFFLLHFWSSPLPIIYFMWWIELALGHSVANKWFYVLHIMHEMCVYFPFYSVACLCWLRLDYFCNLTLKTLERTPKIDYLAVFEHKRQIECK